MNLLYHGSIVVVERPDVQYGRPMLDFGQGFYLTQMQTQAVQWAKRKQIMKGKKDGFVNVYRFDYQSAFKVDKFKLLRFRSYNIDWLNFVISCRAGNPAKEQYDAIEGGVANDRVIDTVEDFMNGVITRNQALGQLRYCRLSHQICFKSQELIDRHLTFVESYKI